LNHNYLIHDFTSQVFPYVYFLPLMQMVFALSITKLSVFSKQFGCPTKPRSSSKPLWRLHGRLHASLPEVLSLPVTLLDFSTLTTMVAST
jgi:hypothetical protein